MMHRGGDAPRRRHGLSRGSAAVALCWLLFVLLVALPFFAGTRTGCRLEGTETLIWWRPIASRAPLAATAVVWFLLLAWSRREFSPGRPRLLLVILACLPMCGAWGLGSFKGWVHWGVGTPVVAADGKTYRDVYGWWTHAIARDDEVSWDRRTMRIVARGGTDSPRRNAVLVSPRGRDVRGLQSAPDGTLVVNGAPRCYVAYDVANGRALARDQLVVLSPFLLLGTEDEGSESDLAELEEGVRTAISDSDFHYLDPVVVPADDVILAETASQNDWVRMAARRLAAAGGDALYPRASKLR